MFKSGPSHQFDSGHTENLGFITINSFIFLSTPTEETTFLSIKEEKR